MKSTIYLIVLIGLTAILSSCANGRQDTEKEENTMQCMLMDQRKDIALSDDEKRSIYDFVRNQWASEDEIDLMMTLDMLEDLKDRGIYLCFIPAEKMDAEKCEVFCPKEGTGYLILTKKEGAVSFFRLSGKTKEYLELFSANHD